MSNNDEDNATIVLDFASLKSQLQDEQELVKENEVTLEFQVKDDSFKLPNAKNKRKSVYLFEFQTNYFSEQCSDIIKSDFVSVIKDLKSLNAILTSDKESIIVFYYNSSPKAVNQLCLQMNKKFPQTKKIIVAKSLSAEKAAIHQKTPSKADKYYSSPIDTQKFLNDLEVL